MEMLDKMTAVSKYSSFTDSQVYWLGEIPSHWELKKLKHVFREKKKKSNPNLNCGSISFGKVVYKDDDKVPESTKASYQEVLAGEYLVNPLNLNYDLISLRIGLSEIDVVVSSGYIVLKNSIQINKTYFNYLLHRYDVAYMKLLGSGVRQTISFNHIADSILAFPPLQEQKSIAEFLDDKTSKIDRAIDQKKQLIELLKERKQIIIQNAVTKGLDPNVKMKDSGVDWIGEIPEHWEVKKTKNLGDIVNGATPSSSISKFWDGEIIWITPTDINEIVYAKSSDRKITHLGYRSCGTTMVPKGSIILTTRAPIGKVCIAGNELCTNQGCKSILPRREMSSNFLYYSFSISSAVLNSLGTGTTFMELSSKALKEFKIPIPISISEQKAIVNHIEKQSEKFKKAIQLEQTQIEKLKEYKASLLDSAVTGKIKVC